MKISSRWVEFTLSRVFKEKDLNPADVDYFLPHMSSDFFRTKIFDQLNKNETPIPYEKWVINLSSLGNVGAASVYFMVDEVFKSDKLKARQKILLLVPKVPGSPICMLCLRFVNKPNV